MPNVLHGAAIWCPEMAAQRLKSSRSCTRQAYRSLQTSTDFDHYLHLPQNACIHQKSLSGLSPIVAEIIDQSVLEGSFTCPWPQETGEIILSVFCFLLGPGIFDWTPEQLDHRLRATASLIEAGLGAEPGSLDFFYTPS